MIQNDSIFIYSSSIIKETIECFLLENDLIISEEEAVGYLNSLSGLFLAFADRKTSALTPKWVEVFSVCHKKESEKVEDSSDLIITHNCKK